MKKRILISFLFITSLVVAQEEFEQQDYNRWSFELATGFQKPGAPAESGYFTATPSFGQYSVGARYMMNNRFGLKADVGYNMFENADNSKPFKSNYLRASLQGVFNLGSILKFETWTNTIGLLGHTGVGYSVLMPKEPVDHGKDQMLHGIIGVTPQFKLTEWMALTTDLSILTHIRQDDTWDGVGKNVNKGLGGTLVNLSAGLTFYLGQNEQHADWISDSAADTESMAEMEKRLAKIETDLIDSDQDGVPDYLDREPNTVSGVAVDTKGRAVDLNNNGIPDELESSLNKLYVTKAESTENAEKAGYANAIKHLIDSGYVNVYFQFNSEKPETYSLEAINYLVTYMNANPTASAELVGYADELGNPTYNQKLSERRAKRVYDILVATGVSESRLSYRGAGADDSVDKSSSPARQLVRRVTFKLK